MCRVAYISIGRRRSIGEMWRSKEKELEVIFGYFPLGVPLTLPPLQDLVSARDGEAPKLFDGSLELLPEVC